MSKYIIITADLLTPLTELRDTYISTTEYKTWANFVKATNQDFQPIRIRDKNGERYVLPLGVWLDPVFLGLREFIDANKTKPILIEELTEADFPIQELDKPISYE
jgi:hypothetical protein